MITRLYSAALLALLLLLAPAAVRAQAGVLLVEGTSSPDSTVLALADMTIEASIDHLHATVRVTQIFENRTTMPLRGRYELALGRGAAVSGFAVWEGEHRREAVVVERQRGRRIFEELTQRNLDPGLLETSDQGPRQNVYAVRVDPIGPHNRVRIEVEYSQELELAADEALFHFPLAGRDAHEQEVEHLRVELEVEGGWPLEGVELRPEALRVMGTRREGDTGFRAELEQRDGTLSDDLMVSLLFDRQPSEPLRPALLSYRADHGTAGRIDRSAFGGGQRYMDDRGYFVLNAPVQLRARDAAVEGTHDLVIALDTSLSMRGGKLERAVAAVEDILQDMRPSDRFALLTFNDDLRQLTGGLAAATPERLAEARRFFREGYLSGGTDLRQAMPAALALLEGSRASRRTVVFVTDGQPSMGSVESTTIADEVRRANLALGESQGRLFILGVGDDANHRLLERLSSETEGLYAHVSEGADITPIMRRFLYQLDAPSLEDIRLDMVGVEGLTDLYPAGSARVFDGSSHVIFGRYSTPTTSAEARLRGRAGARTIEKTLTVELPRSDRARPWIARGWAHRRVTDLLGRIDADGEREEWVREIIALAREHLLVTPYTSLIAAARSLLRPREITPGDPVLRVRTDPTDRSVTALFPFGLTKSLRPLEPGLFETRFLAPTSLTDGRHDVDLVITGADGNQRIVRDHFVIDSRPPRPRIEPLSAPLRAGDTVQLRVRSERDTRHLHAFLHSHESRNQTMTELRWNDEALACVGELRLPPSLPTGTYRLVVVAEDRAHNVGSSEVRLEVLGR